MATRFTHPQVIILLSLVILTFTNFASAADAPGIPAPSYATLVVAITADKQSYRIGEPITVSPSVKNLSADATLSVMRRSEARFFVFTADGKPLLPSTPNSLINLSGGEVDIYGREHFPTAPPNLTVETDTLGQQHLVLKPNEVLTESPVRIDKLFAFTKPGTYRITMLRQPSGLASPTGPMISDLITLQITE